MEFQMNPLEKGIMKNSLNGFRRYRENIDSSKEEEYDVYIDKIPKMCSHKKIINITCDCNMLICRQANLNCDTLRRKITYDIQW